MILRKFNERGIDEFRNILAQCRLGSRVDTPLPITVSDQYSEALATRVDIPEKSYSTRADLAKIVSSAEKKAALANEMVDIGLWSWLSAAYFDTVCPLDNHGVRDPKSDYRHIPSNSYKNFYRHLIRGPVRIYRFFEDSPELAQIVLCQSPSSPGDFVEQLASRQERVTSRAVIGAANILYFDTAKQSAKRGAAANSRKAGTLRRYIDILDQLELTFDLYSMSPRELIEILPAEFDKWQST